MMSVSLSKKVENWCMGTAKDNNMDVIRINIATTIFSLYGKMSLLVALLMDSLTTGVGMARDVIHGIVGCLELPRYRIDGNIS